MEASPTYIQNNNHLALSCVAMHFDLTLSQYTAVQSIWHIIAAILGLLGGQDALVDRTLIIASSPGLNFITACKDDNDKCKISA